MHKVSKRTGDAVAFAKRPGIGEGLKVSQSTLHGLFFAINHVLDAQRCLSK